MLALRAISGPVLASRTAARQHRRSTRAAGPPRCSAEGEEAGPSGREQQAAAPAGLPPAKQMPYGAIAGLAAVGVADTAYLSAVKLLQLSPACPLAGGCADVLTSEYATLWGVAPLALVGLGAYLGMGSLALAGWRRQRQAAAGGSAAEDEPADSPLRTAVLAGGLAMASTSAVLLYILFSQFPGELCPWCLGSAALSFSIAALAASGFRPRDLADTAAPAAGVVAATLLLVSSGTGLVGGSAFASGGYDLDYALPVVTTQSPPKAVELARRLRDSGARMYGAFWCSHCYDQKQAFGAEAMAAFPYVECYPEGLHKDTKMAAACQEAPGGLTGFPTWVMPDGEQLVGEQTFEQLEAALAKAAAASVASAAS